MFIKQILNQVLFQFQLILASIIPSRAASLAVKYLSYVSLAAAHMDERNNQNNNVFAEIIKIVSPVSLSRDKSQCPAPAKQDMNLNVGKCLEKVELLQTRLRAL